MRVQTNDGSKRSGRVHEAHSDATRRKKVQVHSKNNTKKTRRKA